MLRISLRIGSSDSVAISLRLSRSGSPALMPRTITSTASGKLLRNLASRRFFRNAKSRGKSKGKRREQATAQHEHQQEGEQAQRCRPNHELPLGPIQSGLSEPHRQRRALLLLLPLFQLFQSAFDLLAPRLLRTTRRSRYRFRPRDARHPPLGLLFAGQVGVNEHPRHAADRKGDKEKEGVCFHGLASFLSSNVGGIERRRK